MATIAPFRGVRYNPAKVGDLKRTVAPPYDVISAAQLADLRARSPYNIVNVDLPNAEGLNDANPYTEAGKRFREWIREGVMAIDERPAIYAYHQRYRIPGTDEVRDLTGFIAAVRLARWEEGVVLPHEHTFAKPKEDRLRLMRTSQANLSQVYGFYSDPKMVAEEAISHFTSSVEPDIAVIDDDGARHEVWCVDDPAVIAAVATGLADTTLYIADGHHRYETALDYRDEMRAKHGVKGSAGHEYVMMMLVNADAKGLTVLPTHRMVRLTQTVDRGEVKERLAPFFTVEEVPLTDAATGAKEAMSRIGERPEKICMVWKDTMWILTPYDTSKLAAAIEEEASDAWKLLGATILHRVVLEQAVQMPRGQQDDGEHITYTRDATEAVAGVISGECDLACLLNAPSPDVIMEVARAGDAMPHKSTYFYPKLLTGLVVNDLSLPIETI